MESWAFTAGLSSVGSEMGGQLRLERENGHELIRDLVAAFPEQIESISLGKPTLEDVFIRKTGHQFWEADEEVPA